MTDPANQVTLDEVRVRFLDAEARLADAATAIGAIQEAAERIGAAREGLGEAGVRLGQLATSMDEVGSSLADNAVHLREGVDAIRAGDPAEIKRQIEELDAAFTAMQAVVGDRLTRIEQQQGAISADVKNLAASLEAHASASRRELQIVAGSLGVLVVIAIIVAFLR